MTDNSKKRKAPSTTTSSDKNSAKRPRFPGRPHHQISTTPTSRAFPNDEINVASFVKAYANEIKALEKSIPAAKKGLMRRAFQEVPRDMRRRNASHNPQRVPKRLRARARAEAKVDNTPVSRGKSGSGFGTGKRRYLRQEGIEREKGKKKARDKKAKGDGVTVSVIPQKDVEMQDVRPKTDNATTVLRKKSKKLTTLATAPNPPAKFRKRQVHKTWLPTHLFHTKRAHLTAPKEPLWRFAIPLTPTSKTYRVTHRAATLRGAVAWDMSYISTIWLEGVEASVVGLLKALHFDMDNEELWENMGKAKKWRAGTRAWEGWIYEREGKLPKAIAPVVVIWSSMETPDDYKRRVFIRVHPSAFLQLWNEIIRAAKVQKPAVAVQDLRFEIGSIEITGPAALETLCCALTPTGPSTEWPQAVWPMLAQVTNIGLLPANALLAFSITDPRLRYPPQPTPLPCDEASQRRLTETLATWPVDKSFSPPAIFNRNARLAAQRSMASQKSINRRKGAAVLGQFPEPRSTDPQIPVLAYVSKESGSWTVLLPWKCVAPVWRHIMFYPVSTGGTPKFGGLAERRQLYYERSRPWFPADCPGTDAGWKWELEQRLTREQEWKKRPKGKRVEWTSIDLGNGRKGELGDPWACGWERLLSKAGQLEMPAKMKDGQDASLAFRQLHKEDAEDALSGKYSPSNEVAYLFNAKITMVQRGVPKNCARIYRLPTTDPELRKKYLSLLPNAKSASKPKLKKPANKYPSSGTRNLPSHIRQRAMAAHLLERPEAGDGILKAGDAEYPMVPGELDLIGFVTTGNYNLGEGKPTAVASLALHKVVECSGEGKYLCIVREAGQSLGRLAKWEVV